MLWFNRIVCIASLGLIEPVQYYFRKEYQKDVLLSVSKVDCLDHVATTVAETEVSEKPLVEATNVILY